MKKFMFNLTAVACVFMNAPLAFAYTYSTDDLVLTKQGLLNDERLLNTLGPTDWSQWWWDDVSDMESYPVTTNVSFDANFLATNSGGSAEVFIEEWGIGSTRNWEPIAKEFTWNDTGELIGWNLRFFYEDNTPFSSATGDGYFAMLLDSSYGTGTCNCDKYIYAFDLMTGTDDRYRWVGRRGIWYQGESSLDNWITAPVKLPSAQVSEPTPLHLMLLGTLLIGATRLRSIKESQRVPNQP